MKMKKLVALGAAAAMSMTMCVNVFADSEVKNAVNAGYAGAQASYTGTISAANGTQMTVVVLKAIAQNADLENEDIEYINQDVADSALYTNMGTKDDLLATDENGNAIYAGDYVIRVGFYDAKGAWNVAEGTFTIDTKANADTTITVKWGDITGDSSIDSSDAIAALRNFAGLTESYTVNGSSVAVGSMLGDYKWGDITGDSAIDSSDAIAALRNFAGLVESYTVNGSSVAVGSNVDIVVSNN